jgi:hypothetical protein
MKFQTEIQTTPETKRKMDKFPEVQKLLREKQEDKGLIEKWKFDFPILYPFRWLRFDFDLLRFAFAFIFLGFSSLKLPNYKTRK